MSDIKVFPRSDEYRDHFDDIFHPDDQEDLFKASPEDLKKLEQDMGTRQNYMERVREKYGKGR